MVSALISTALMMNAFAHNVASAHRTGVAGASSDGPGTSGGTAAIGIIHGNVIGSLGNSTNGQNGANGDSSNGAKGHTSFGAKG